MTKNVSAETKPIKCDCYHEEVKTRPMTDFEKGLLFLYGKTGALAKTDERVEYTEGRCWGTRECEICSCGGDKGKCDWRN